MKQFDMGFTDARAFINSGRKPRFYNMQLILERKAPDRPTLFEFAINNGIVNALTADISYDDNDPNAGYKKLADAYRIAGHDFALIRGRSYYFKTMRPRHEGKSTISLNDGHLIYDRGSFERYEWPEPENADHSWLDAMLDYMPEGMKILLPGPDGIFETVLALVGHVKLCYMLYDDPELARDIVDAVGDRFDRYYGLCVGHDAVGFMMADDDWGFKTQTFLSSADMRKYILPWHKKFTETVHRGGKPMVLHSCGNIEPIMDDVIDDAGYDGRHSFEDTILPAEDAYEKYCGRIAILGGIDVDFLCRAEPADIYARSCAMLERARGRGGYALGSGNSVPDYVPAENYYAMISAAVMNG